MLIICQTQNTATELILSTKITRNKTRNKHQAAWKTKAMQNHPDIGHYYDNAWY